MKNEWIIHYILDKIKQNRLAVLSALLIIASSSFSFYLGYSSKTCKSSIYAIHSDTDETSKTRFIASKRGKYFYPEWCSSAKRIKEQNRVYFNSAKEAQNAGYKISDSCGMLDK